MELLMVIVIVGILATIAYPSYLNQVRKSRRVVAKSALLDAANRQEQFFFGNRAYATGLNQLTGFTNDTVLFDKNSSVTTTTADAVYALSVATAVNSGSGTCGTLNAPCFQLQAVPQNDQTNDACGTFTLDSSNAKSASASDCW